MITGKYSLLLAQGYHSSNVCGHNLPNNPSYELVSSELWLLENPIIVHFPCSKHILYLLFQQILNILNCFCFKHFQTQTCLINPSWEGTTNSFIAPLTDVQPPSED